MACVKLTIPPLPSLGPVGLPSLTIPPFGGGAGINFCCQINFGAFITLPSLPGIPILANAFALINADIVLVNAYLKAKDLVSFSCPLD